MTSAVSRRTHRRPAEALSARPVSVMLSVLLVLAMLSVMLSVLAMLLLAESLPPSDRRRCDPFLLCLRLAV